MDFLKDISPFLTLIAIVGLAAGNFFTNFKTGGSNVSKEVIANYKELQAQLKDEIAAVRKQREDQERHFNEQINTLTGQLGQMKGKLEEKEKQIEILQGVDLSKNPAMLKFMQNSDDREGKILEALKQIAEFMGKVNQHFDAAHTTV